MALATGTRLGSYEIVDAIGAGGMGEVYRAADEDLKRDVAIKVLPEAFAADADRLARFQREAETLASLNHPNIAQIYGLERGEASTSAPSTRRPMSSLRFRWCRPTTVRSSLPVPDGTRVAVTRGGQVGTIWVWSLAQRNWTRLEPDSDAQGEAFWTRDGERIVYTKSNVGLFARRADGAGPAAEMVMPGIAFATGETADGKLLLTTISVGQGANIGALAPGADAPPEPLIATDFNEIAPTLSPDGRWLAYESDESGVFEVYVRPFPDVDSRRYTVSNGGGRLAKWAPDGTALYFAGPTSLMRAAVETGQGFVSRPPEPVVDMGVYAKPGEAGGYTTYDVAADGRVLMIKTQESSAAGAGNDTLVFVRNGLTEALRSLR